MYKPRKATLSMFSLGSGFLLCSEKVDDRPRSVTDRCWVLVVAVDAVDTMCLCGGISAFRMLVREKLMSTGLILGVSVSRRIVNFVVVV